jgi:transposase, IS5 family
LSRAGPPLCRPRGPPASSSPGGRLSELLDRTNTASGVWADTAYRSKKNEALLKRRMFVSHIHRRKPRGRPMPERPAKANAGRSSIRAHVEPIVAEQKDRMGLFVRTIGLARAKTKIGLANLSCNMKRLLWLERRALPA